VSLIHNLELLTKPCFCVCNRPYMSCIWKLSTA